MCSPYRLSSTYPAYGCQEGTPLTIYTPHLTPYDASLHCQSRSLFRLLDLSGDTDSFFLYNFFLTKQLLLLTSCRTWIAYPFANSWLDCLSIKTRRKGHPLTIDMSINNHIWRIPYGVADFVKLRQGGEYYIDKTAYLPILEEAGRSSSSNRAYRVRSVAP